MAQLAVCVLYKTAVFVVFFFAVVVFLHIFASPECARCVSRRGNFVLLLSQQFWVVKDCRKLCLRRVLLILTLTDERRHINQLEGVG